MPCWTFLLVTLTLVVHDQFYQSMRNDSIAKNEVAVSLSEQKPKPVPSPAVIRPPKPTPPPLFPTNPKQPIIYLIQMEGNLPPPNLWGADIMCITWKFPRHPCTYLPNSTWSSGRNYMWKMATTMDVKYEYYVFMDEDILVSNLTLWEETLLRYRPAVGVPGGIAQVLPNTDTTPESRVLTCFDAAFNAFHYDLVHDSLVLPYVDLFDNFGWWLAQLYMIYLTQVRDGDWLEGSPWAVVTCTPPPPPTYTRKYPHGAPPPPPRSRRGCRGSELNLSTPLDAQNKVLRTVPL